ncbi:putative oxidoreductase (fatty acid repression mutant protein) [Weissella beninensis]|uniref:Nitroreductase family protein n=1 Tax=Periweissella beninensis TaxID=504936 RepID=A0ABT0VKV3_9LACO|nr:nitroreductase family protein [Periweissella beninensis]MBM7544477.1 putative oxidoreductase (fatty acid repression mutant protein) [Periweissella beninensis]MCM2437047.1 nitroreductase family protein [Periweissella beninensis]
MEDKFLELQKKRRTIYALGKNVELTNDEIENLVKSAVKEAPTAFNNQSTRAVILFNEKHDKFWDIVVERLHQEVPDEDAYAKTVAKINAFKAAYGTVLFYTDMAIVKSFEENVPFYAEKFYDWSEQGMGIANYSLWLALTDNNLGASLQHYNPIIDELVAKEFDIPSNWRLRSQMPFGSIESPAGEKDYIEDNERFRVLDK